jgi:ribosomal protein S18 acetylase RimI-like enzyme
MEKMGRVYEENGVIKGVSARTEQRETPVGTRADVWVFTAPALRRRGIGTALWNEAWSSISQDAPHFLSTTYRGDQGDGPEFYARRGFGYWLAVHSMAYQGPAVEYSSALFPVPYKDDFFYDFIRLTNEGFLGLRQENDILPHQCYPPGFDEVAERERLDKEKDNIYFFRDGTGEIVGYAFVDSNVVDTVTVTNAHTRKGYGREMMFFCIKLIIERGHSNVTLEVVETNRGAKKLYDSLGFTLVESTHVARRFL